MSIKLPFITYRAKITTSYNGVRLQFPTFPTKYVLKDVSNSELRVKIQSYHHLKDMELITITCPFVRYNYILYSEAPVRQHLAKVYGCLGATTGFATVGAYAYMANIYRADLLGLFASIGLLLGLILWRDNGKNFLPRLGMLMGFGLVTGKWAIYL